MSTSAVQVCAQDSPSQSATARTENFEICEHHNLYSCIFLHLSSGRESSAENAETVKAYNVRQKREGIGAHSGCQISFGRLTSKTL